MSSKLVLISIGPVQDFIASARKLRDLWYGSYLLSEMSKTAAKSLLEQGGSIIFPAVEKADDLVDLTVANKILASFPDSTNCDSVIKRARSAWSSEWGHLASETLKVIKTRFKGLRINEELFKKEVFDYGDFFAAWIRFDSDYKVARDRLETLLSGRKSFRNFSQPCWEGAGIPKNSLDGVREAVTGDNTPEITGLLKKNERLDALGCIKRFAPLQNRKDVKHFDDLSDVALIPYLCGICKKPESLELLHEFTKAASKNELGLRPQNRKLIKNTNVGPVNVPIWSDLFFYDKEQLESLYNSRAGKQVWEALSKLTSKEGAGPLNKYACVLVGDGDKMGSAIDAIGTIEGHTVFTKALSRFASVVTDQIEQNNGSCIYSGGDDVLAYVPLHSAVECSEQIQKTFVSVMSEACSRAGIPNLIPTFSIGLAIVHHSEPLYNALAVARKAEKIAKTQAGRDAFAMIQSKRSGNDIVVFGNWNSFPRRIKKMVDAYNREHSPLPATIGYQLRSIRMQAGDSVIFETMDGEIVPKNAAAALVLQLFMHKGRVDIEKQEFISFLSGVVSIEQLSNELVVAKQLAEVERIAQGKSAEVEEL